MPTKFYELTIDSMTGSMTARQDWADSWRDAGGTVVELAPNLVNYQTALDVVAADSNPEHVAWFERILTIRKANR